MRLIPTGGRLHRALALLALALATALATPLLGTAPSAHAATSSLPCDIYAAGGTPCEAAYSTTRALFASYGGPLYQIQRTSDSSYLNISPASAGGVADGSVSLRAHSDQDYVTAEGGGSAPLIANRTTIGPWEKFDLVRNADGSISFRAHANNDIVTADNYGSSPLIANRTAIGQREEFDLIYD